MLTRLLLPADLRALAFEGRRRMPGTKRDLWERWGETGLLNDFA